MFVQQIGGRSSRHVILNIILHILSSSGSSSSSSSRNTGAVRQLCHGVIDRKRLQDPGRIDARLYRRHDVFFNDRPIDIILITIIVIVTIVVNIGGGDSITTVVVVVADDVDIGTTAWIPLVVEWKPPPPPPPQRAGTTSPSNNTW